MCLYTFDMCVLGIKVYICTHIYRNSCVHMYCIYVRVCAYKCTHTYTIYLNVCVYTCVCVCVCIYVCGCVCVLVPAYTCIHRYTHICIKQ